MGWWRGLLMAVCVGLAAPCEAACAPQSCPVLVVDFTGNLATDALGQADQLDQTLLPEAVPQTIGNHGVVPDAWRGSARYSAIIRTDSADERAAAAAQVYGLTRASSRTVLAFDMNELIPNQVREQIRQAVPGWLDNAVVDPGFRALLWVLRKLPNKTDRQADVAADVIAQWKAAHPDGKVLIRGHSDGTYSVMRVLERLQSRGLAPDAVVLASVRQQYDEWAVLARHFVTTLFIDIGARNDFDPAGGPQRSAAPTSLPNWRHLQLTADANAFAAHGATTDLFHIQAMQRTDRFGTVALQDATLGAVLNHELRPIIATGAEHMLRSAGLDGRTRLAPQDLARLRRDAQADLDHVGKGIPVWHDAAVQYLEEVHALTDRITEATTPWGRPPGPTIAGIKDLAAAVEQDIDESRGTRFVLLRSRTLEKLGDVGLDMVQELGRQYGDTKLKRLAPVIENIDVVRSYVRVLARAAGGRYEAEDVKQVVDTTADVVKRLIQAEAEAELELQGADPGVAKRALAKLKTTLMLFDMVGDLAQAIAVRGEAGQWTIAAVDRLSDALISAGATLLVMPVAAAGGAEVAPYLRDAIAINVRFIRDASKGSRFWAWLWGRSYGNRFAIVEAYSQYQQAMVRRGLRAQDIDELFGTQALRDAGLGDREIAQSKDQNRLYNTHTAMAAAKTATPERQPAAAKQELPVKEPDKPETEREAKLKPHRNDSQLLPPPGRRDPPDVAGGGPGPGPSGGGAGGSGPGPCNGPGAAGCGGIDLGLTALVIDAETRRVVALAEGGEATADAVEPELMALAVWLEYTNQRAAFSLDPFDPRNPRGPWLRAVYFPDGLRGTRAGNQCFDADFRLKQLSFGVRLDGQRVVEDKSASGLESLPTRMNQQAGAGERATAEQWARMWIVSREVHMTVGDGIGRIERARMGVEARRQVPDPTTRSGLRDVATPADAIEGQFAQQFEALYDQLARTDAPSLAFVRDATKALALARWMRQSGVRPDMEAVVAQLNATRVAPVDKVSTLSVGWSSRTQKPYADSRGQGVVTTTREIRMTGGIDLSVEPTMDRSPRDHALRDAVAQRLREANPPARFTLRHGGRVYRATMLPFRLAEGAVGQIGTGVPKATQTQR